jgi:hypothetical protein
MVVANGGGDRGAAAISALEKLMVQRVMASP